jgi:hypothetical protein
MSVSTTFDDDDALLLPQEAANYLRMSVQTLANWRCYGGGPKFTRVGNRVFYYGQRICIDPASKLVMVQTALEDHDEVWRLWSTLVEQFGQG